MSDKLEKLRLISEQVEQGITEVGDQEGLVIEAHTYYRDKKAKLPEHVMLFQRFALWAAVNLTPSTCKVLFKLFAISEYENFISIDIKTMSEELGLVERSVSRAIKELKISNIVSVVKHTQDRRRNDYFINPYASWKGGSFQRNKTIQELKNKQYKLEFPIE